MRTLHAGVAGSDITQGLPRVEELFEARKPKGLAEICEGDGRLYPSGPTDDNELALSLRRKVATASTLSPTVQDSM